MIRINDYCSIAFVKWVRNLRYFNDLNDLNDVRINELVETYLKENVQKWNLRFFLKLFQDYIIRFDTTILQPRDLITTFEDFCMSVKSLEFIDPDSVYKDKRIYTLLNEFCNYVSIDTSNHINNELKRIASVSFENREGVLGWFNEVIKFYSEDLCHLFRDYIQNIFGYDFELFSAWVYKKKRVGNYFEPTNYDKLSIDYIKHQIIEEIKNGTVDYNIQQRIKGSTEGPIRMEYIALTKEYSPLDFFHYLAKKDINIFKQVPKEILEGLAEEYLKQFPDANKKIIYDLIREMRDKKKKFSRFSNIFRTEYGNNLDFKRYISCKYHGVFLFRKNDNLSKFLKRFWQDIHVGTGDTIDFYFTDQDIKSDYHCKMWIEKYSNMEIDVKEFPSISLWELGCNDKYHILLKCLSHEEIFDVIEYLTAQLESTSFSQSIIATNIKIKEIIDNKKATQNIYVAMDSQIGAFGENATSNDNAFNK